MVLLGYVSVAAVLDVTLAFAAFLAGFGIVSGMKSTEHQRFQAPLDSINHVSGAVFIPIYFAIVGYRLDFTKGFSPLMLIGFLLGSSVVVLLSIGLAARLAGFRRLDIINLALTCNARGGPGIVLASVAFDAGIINAPFFTTLVLTAVLTSQACGVWLTFVLRRGWPLLSSEGPLEQHKPATVTAGELNRVAVTLTGRAAWRWASTRSSRNCRRASPWPTRRPPSRLGSACCRPQVPLTGRDRPQVAAKAATGENRNIFIEEEPE